MKKTKTCTICGNKTDKVLFKDKILDIPICSRKCEYEYLKNLTPDKKDQINVVRALDDIIEAAKRFNKILWGISGCALVPVIAGIGLANALLFLVGTVVASVTTLFTRHFEEKINKLMLQRKRILI